MMVPSTSAATAPASIPSCLFTSDSTHSLPFCSTGQTSNVVVASNGVVTYQFNYPGDNSNITFWASVSPIDPIVAPNIGVNIFDTNTTPASGTPVETATTLSNQANSDPKQMQFNYSSATNGPVTLQFFNGSPNAVTFAMNDSGLVVNTGNGATTTPVTLQLVSGATPGAAVPAAPVAPVASVPGSQPVAAPAQGATGKPATIPSCQYTTDNTHPLPFCSTGQVSTIVVPAGSSINYKLNYPGDNSNITFTSSLNPIDPTVASAVGVNVYDTTSQAQPPMPVEVATTLTNQANSDPKQMQFNYSSGTAGLVTLQLFNYSPNAVTFSFNDSGLVVNSSSGLVTTPVTLQLA